MKALATKCWQVVLPILLVGLMAVGCNREDAASTPVAAKSGPNGAGQKYLLTAEPAGAKPVKEVRKDAKDGDEVVVIGFIGGDKKPWIEGRAGFWIVDSSLMLKEPDGSMCWDCCEVPPDDLRQGKATIKVVDEQGQTVPVDAQQLLSVKVGQTVVVHGRAKRDEQGNLIVLADGVFVRP
jgi:hypothetical protein